MAWRVLEAVGDGAYADLALERELKRTKLSLRDRALATELAYGAIRQRRRLDGWLDRLGKVPAAKQPPRLRWLLHVGLQQILLMDRVPASAAVSTAVELAKRERLQRLAPAGSSLPGWSCRQRCVQPGRWCCDQSSRRQWPWLQHLWCWSSPERWRSGLQRTEERGSDSWLVWGCEEQSVVCFRCTQDLSIARAIC